jgi:hypothetical protein
MRSVVGMLWAGLPTVVTDWPIDRREKCSRGASFSKRLSADTSAVLWDHYLRVVAGSRPAKSPKAFVGGLTVAVCYAAKWLKSSVERLFGKSEGAPLWGPTSQQNGARSALVAALRYQNHVRDRALQLFSKQSQKSNSRKLGRREGKKRARPSTPRPSLGDEPPNRIYA